MYRMLLFFSFLLSVGAKVESDIQPKTLTEFSELSQQIREVLPKIKAATVCLDLGAGMSGSGVIVSSDGLILSAAHVTQEVGKEFEVIFEDGRRVPAVGLGMDTSNDASMGEITLKGEYPYVDLSEIQNVGQYVLSLGHSGGFDKERGLVLRLGRVTELSDTSAMSDCSLIGGDSGGPLFDLEGNLIGIHSRVGSVTNSNTHIPTHVFTQQWDQLKSGELMGDGTFANAGITFLGMRLLSQEEKLVVIEVEKASKADETGITEGDVLLSVNGKAVASEGDIFEVLQTLSVSEEGVEVSIKYEAGGEEKSASFVF